MKFETDFPVFASIDYLCPFQTRDAFYESRPSAKSETSTYFDIRSLTHSNATETHELLKKGLSILFQNLVRYLTFYNFPKICTPIHRSICEIRTEYFRLLLQV